MPRFIDQSGSSQGDKVPFGKSGGASKFKFRFSKKWILPGIAFSIIGFTAYLWILFGQLQTAFQQLEQFIPMRIYSDVARIAPPEPRADVEERLKALGYSTTLAADTITFALHPIDYPTYLVPDKHPIFDIKDQPITLHFDGEDSDALLHSIEVGGHEIPDLYLEPELVATLSRGSKEIRAFVPFGEIPAMVWQAIISVEDQHFLEHKGLDPRGLARAIWVNLRTRSFSQGGSTITQQLVKNLMARHSKNLFRKMNEIFLALLLELQIGKEKILERYLNEVYLGQVGNLEVHGVAEGARHFFGKKLEDLNLGEIALMAGLIRGPGYYSPYRYMDRALERQHWVLKKMVETGQIAEEEMQAALKLPIRLAPPQTAANKAPYFTDFVKAELIRELKDKMTEQEISQAGFRVYTTLDVAMNVDAQRAVAAGITNIEKSLKLSTGERLEGALASVDQNTGYIRALVGGRNYAQSNFNRILNMRRQVGSTFKPIVYLSAFLKGEDPNGIAYGPGHPADDAPWTLVFDRGKQNWSPRNYEKDYLGWITFRTALAHSINTVAAKLGYEIGIGNIIETARAIGIDSELPEVPSLALGVSELSPVELLKAYSVIANHGIQNELTVIRSVTMEDHSAFRYFVNHPKQVVDPASADLVADMLQNVFTDGTARAAIRMGLDRPAAGKTGTTSHHRDAWFAGFTPQLTTVVWVGMDQSPVTPKSEEAADTGEDRAKGKIMLTGATSALPIWVQFMNEALSTEPPLQFPQSPYLTDVKVDEHSGKIATSGCPDNQVIVEKYIRGHEPKSSGCEAQWPESFEKTVGK